MNEFIGPLLEGTLITIQITAASSLLAFAVAMAAGLMRLSPVWIVRAAATCYIEVFRGTSLLVQLFWWYFVLPMFGIFLDPFVVGVAGIAMNLGAYGAEVVRGAVEAVPRGQYEAAIALNMTPALRMRRIVLPQALRAMLPPWGNLLIELLKSTSLVSLITLQDLTFVGNQLNAATYRTLEIFSLVLLLYYVIGRLVITPSVRLLERRVNRGIVRSVS